MAEPHDRPSPPISYPLATSTWDDRELEAIAAVVASQQFTMGERVRAFEAAFANQIGSPHAVMVNSGSSANLLTVSAQLYRSRGALRPGDEVIVPAVSWGTTFYPVHQCGMDLRFVDVDLDTFNIDPDRVEAAITPRTRAIFAVNLLGAPCDFARLREICDANDLILLEDNCESLGGEIDGRCTGTFAECSAHSTFFSHHISTIEGGVIATADEELRQILVSLRAHGWTRDLPQQNFIHPKSDDPFYNLFTFVLPGYNVRPTELAAAVGLCQLEKLPGFLIERRKNAQLYQELFGDLEHLAVQCPKGSSSWFSFTLVARGALKDRRNEIVHYLAQHGVDTRPVVAGNFTRNPVIQHLRHTVAGPLSNADTLDHQGFIVGNHHYEISDELVRLRELLAPFLD